MTMEQKVLCSLMGLSTRLYCIVNILPGEVARLTRNYVRGSSSGCWAINTLACSESRGSRNEFTHTRVSYAAVSRICRACSAVKLQKP